MRVTVDATRCGGFGACIDICPSVFQPDDWGFAMVLGDGEVAAEHQDAVRRAARTCPEQAIRIEQVRVEQG